MNFTELLSQARTDDGKVTYTVAEDWMQGRTTYGGLTAALCLNAALPIADGRPVRSAQVAFVGPVSGDVTCTPTLLRAGKNTAFISVRMTGESGVAAETIFAFGMDRTSQLDFAHLPMPQVTAPDDTISFFPADRPRPNFTNHFNMRRAAGGSPGSGSQESAISIWLRHKDPSVTPEPVSVLALADAPPPAAMSMIDGFAPISSMTWMAEFLTDDFSTSEGWFLAHHDAQTAQNGYSSQAMTLWAADGKPVMIGRQTIAVFG